MSTDPSELAENQQGRTPPDPDPAEIAVLRARVAELEAENARLTNEHHEALAEIEGRYVTMTNHLRSGLTYQLGELLVSLANRRGRRRFPGRAWRLAREVWARRRRTASVDLSWVDATPRSGVRAMSIMDEFSHACWAHELELDPVKPATWSNSLERNRPDALFLETAWTGNGGAWTYAFSKWEQDGDLARLIARCRRAGVPTVLWNKEDPVNFDLFVPVARAVDHVATTGIETIERYRATLGHDRVFPLMFAAQPRLHNPIGRVKPTGICFAGAWRGHKYPERGQHLEMLLDAAVEVGDLGILDREPERGTDPSTTFPTRFQPFIRGSLPYSEMLGAYRDHAVFLNANSVSDSSSMLSRRVFELLACRTPVVSGPSLAIETHLSGLVPTPTNKKEAVETLSRLAGDEDERDRLGQKGYRVVMGAHTYRHRLEELAEAIGLALEPTPVPSVELVCVTQRPERLEDVIEMYESQTHPSRRLLVVTNHDGFDHHRVDERLASVTGARAIHLPQQLTLGECLNEAIAQSTADWVAKVDDDDWYGRDYLADQLLALNFTDASVLGKRSIHAYVESVDRLVVRYPGEEFRPCSFVMGGTLLMRRADLGGLRFAAVPSGTDTRFQRDCREAGLAIFSTDRFNYTMVRRHDTSSHTWHVSDRDFLRDCRTVERGARRDLVEV